MAAELGQRCGVRSATATADAHHPDDVAEDLWAHHDGAATQFPSVLRLRGASTR